MCLERIRLSQVWYDNSREQKKENRESAKRSKHNPSFYFPSTVLRCTTQQRELKDCMNLHQALQRENDRTEAEWLFANCWCTAYIRERELERKTITMIRRVIVTVALKRREQYSPSYSSEVLSTIVHWPPLNSLMDTKKLLHSNMDYRRHTEQSLRVRLYIYAYIHTHGMFVHSRGGHFTRCTRSAQQAPLEIRQQTQIINVDLDDYILCVALCLPRREGKTGVQEE